MVTCKINQKGDIKQNIVTRKGKKLIIIKTDSAIEHLWLNNGAVYTIITEVRMYRKEKKKKDAECNFVNIKMKILNVRAAAKKLKCNTQLRTISASEMARGLE